MIKIDCKNPIEFEPAASAAYRLLGLSGNGVVELDIVGEQKIRTINNEFRGIDKPTDVLSFPTIEAQKPSGTNAKKPNIKPLTPKNYPFESNENGEVLLGSIVICRQIAKKQAAKYGHSIERELSFLFVHGLLHLLGYDHIEDGDRAIMRIAEEEILAQIGLLRTE